MKIVLIFLLLFCTFSDCKKLKPKCNCGLPTSKTRNDRIFRGHDALPHQYPWQILMEIKVKNNVFQNGGVLVSKRHILTNAHAFYAGTLYKKRYFLEIIHLFYTLQSVGPPIFKFSAYRIKMFNHVIEK